MQVGLVTGEHTLELKEMPEPVPEPGKAVVEIALCGICGTDLDAWVTGEPYNPAICGHEWTGAVRALPADVTHVKEGDRVGIGIAPPCGKCPACASGDPGHCFPAAGGLIGLGPLAAAHGGFAPAIAFEAARLVRIRDGIQDIAAAMLEPATVALHAVHRTGVRMGDGCLVLGAGPIGLLTMQCAFAAGAGAVAVSEPHPARRAEAAALGATAIIDPRTEIPAERCREIFGAVGPDVVFECAGVPGTLQLAADLARRGGTVSLVGLASRPEEITPAIWLAKEITMVASLAYESHEFEHTMALMQDGRLRTDPLHTSTVGLAELGGAFERLHDEPEEIKILVDPRA